MIEIQPTTYGIRINFNPPSAGGLCSLLLKKEEFRELQDLLKRRGEACKKCRGNYAAICVCEAKVVTDCLSSSCCLHRKAVEPPEKPKEKPSVRAMPTGNLLEPYERFSGHHAILEILDEHHEALEKLKAATDTLVKQKIEDEFEKLRKTRPPSK